MAKSLKLVIVRGRYMACVKAQPGPRCLYLYLLSREALVVSPCLILVKHLYMFSFSHLTSLYGIRLSFLEFLGAFIAMKVPLFLLYKSQATCLLHFTFTNPLSSMSTASFACQLFQCQIFLALGLCFWHCHFLCNGN